MTPARRAIAPRRRAGAGHVGSLWVRWGKQRRDVSFFSRQSKFGHVWGILGYSNILTCFTVNVLGAVLIFVVGFGSNRGPFC